MTFFIIVLILFYVTIIMLHHSFPLSNKFDNDEEEGAKVHWLRFLFRKMTKSFLAGLCFALRICS